jgi:3-isopropylmalate/(R)-2-methylmalate dehydratase small subunit
MFPTFSRLALQPFAILDQLVVPVDRLNVDTDAILPKQYMKMIGRTGFGLHLFDEWRYLDAAEPGDDCSMRRKNPDFPLNLARYEGAGILLGRANFGCGFSREHAVWALSEWGIRALVAPSFAEIFRGNCLKNGLLPIVLPETVVDGLFEAVQSTSGYRIVIDLHAQTVRVPDSKSHPFEIHLSTRRCCSRAWMKSVSPCATHPISTRSSANGSSKSRGS